VTVLTPAVKEVAAGAVVDGGTTVVVEVVAGGVVGGVVEVDVVLVEVLADVGVAPGAAEAGRVEALRPAEVVPLHALIANRGSATESTVRSQ
jgi:hypothetical protein